MSPSFPVWGPHDTAPQRTQLAWQRTAMALVVAALVLGRITVEMVGFPAVCLCGAATITAGWVAMESRTGRRPQRARQALLLTCSVAALAATELAVML